MCLLRSRLVNIRTLAVYVSVCFSNAAIGCVFVFVMFGSIEIAVQDVALFDGFTYVLTTDGSLVTL